MPGRRLLVLTYHYPPDPSVGARRWDAMAAWLRELGHDVTVLTTRAWGAEEGERSEIVRSADLVAIRTLRAVLRRPALPAAGRPMPLQKPAPRLLADVVVPDAYLLSWGLGAVPVARRLIRERAIECVVTSGPPHSCHVLGLMLGSRRPAWIADFRDGWRHEMLRAEWPTKLQDRLDERLERSVVSTADGVVGVTRPIAEDFAARLAAGSVHVPNGWDPRAEPGIAQAGRTSLDRGVVNIVHTGQLSGLRGRDPRSLFDALDRLLSDRPGSGERIRIVLAGRLDVDERAMLDRLGSGQHIVHVGHLDRFATAALQREADALLLLTSRGHPTQATGKLFEYLAAGRPIIALAEGNEAARIVTETRTGIAVAPDDVEAIAGALRAAVDGTLARSYAPRGLERYVYPVPAIEFSEEIERVLAGRGQ